MTSRQRTVPFADALARDPDSRFQVKPLPDDVDELMTGNEKVFAITDVQVGQISVKRGTGIGDIAAFLRWVLGFILVELVAFWLLWSHGSL